MPELRAGRVLTDGIVECINYYEHAYRDAVMARKSDPAKAITVGEQQYLALCKALNDILTEYPDRRPPG